MNMQYMDGASVTCYECMDNIAYNFWGSKGFILTHFSLRVVR